MKLNKEMNEKHLALSKRNTLLILNSIEVPSAIRKKLTQNNVKVTFDEADILRDLCAEKLDIYGFDEKYEPTKLGQNLETLIDVLYTG
ncbi:MAG: hypothetical protein IID52_04710 [Proteobacteria bacterium]|nr:hypothetical protein [Pseudomonadota bacterium]